MFPADNTLTVEGIALGRKLSHEKALSDDYSMSCATCHQQEFAFTDPRVVSLRLGRYPAGGIPWPS
ncbi:MAG: hypothetical protein IPO60_18220 [Flavobacteriales bacterium]|nr:hypothetical protein [Flavobacteriales bacterium]